MYYVKLLTIFSYHYNLDISFVRARQPFLFDPCCCGHCAQYWRDYCDRSIGYREPVNRFLARKGLA